jgi:hypothetical protein
VEASVLARGPSSARLLGRYAVLALVVAVAATVHVRRPATFCLLRATTGIPCPFCGGTTAAVDAAHGRLGAALGASPIALPMLLAWPWSGRPLPAVLANRRLRWGLVLGILAVAEVWQLQRFGWLGH